VPASGRGFIAAERWKAIDYAKESGPRQADVSPPGTIAAGHGSPHEGLEEAAVTNYMIVKQKVRDLATFQKAFDGLARSGAPRDWSISANSSPPTSAIP
jgi:hypothetical protein